MIEYRTGDLFAQDDLNALAHGVNCDGVMGAGIAPVFKRLYPGMYTQYKLACDTGLLEPGHVFPWITHDHSGSPSYVFNIASQDHPGANARRSWLFSGLIEAIVMCETLRIYSLGVPRIGAGIGGLEWADVRAIYEHVAMLLPAVNLVVVSLPEATS